jgi:hypothetical protein
MPRLSPVGTPLSDWTLAETLKDLGYRGVLRQGRVSVEEDGSVTVKDARQQVRFDGPIATRDEFDDLISTLGRTARKDKGAPARPPEAVLAENRAVHFENRANDRIWYGMKLQTELDEQYRFGARFELPLVALPRKQGSVLCADIPGLDLSALKAFFVQPDGRVLVPVHPQEMAHRGFAKPSQTMPVRCASSERTVHALDVLLKLDLANILHSGVRRPIDKVAAQFAVSMTEFLHGWAQDHLPPDSAFCFLPEPMALIDRKADAAAIVRSTTPFPPPPDGKKTWLVPAYTLTARDQDFPDEAPLLIRLVEQRPDPKVDPIDYALEKIVGPLVDSALTVHIDLGSSAQAHGQNTFLELGEDGHPTGRIAYSDLEAFWPHPELAASGGREDFYDQYDFVHEEVKEAKIYGTFIAYFESQNFNKVVEHLRGHYPGRAAEISRRAGQLLHDGLEARRGRIEQHQHGPLEGFAQRLKYPYW